MIEKIYRVNNFSLKHTLECGQVFRFEEIKENQFEIYSGNRYAVAKQLGNSLIIETHKETNYFENYFDLKTDYSKLLKGFYGDKSLEHAMDYCGGIRILRQEKWETLASFILSSNNNIKRIKGIIDRFCSLLGDEIEGGYAFPNSRVVSKLNVEDLAPIRSGFRAKYLIDAAIKVENRTVDLDKIEDLDLEKSKENLKLINGVGDKVAECVLLFGFHKMEAFPIDVWIKKVINEKYPNGLSDQINSSRGLAQQILFHYERNKDRTEIKN